MGGGEECEDGQRRREEYVKKGGRNEGRREGII